MTTEDCFQAAARVETLLRNLYLGLARCFRTQPPAAAAFRTLAAGVAQHALRIRLLAIHRRPDAGAGDSSESVSEDILAMVVELSAMAVNVRHDPDGASALRVLRRVIDAERRCHAVHAAVLRRSGDPVVRGLFSTLARRDADRERLLGRVTEATGSEGLAPPVRRPTHALSCAGGGSFAVASRARAEGPRAVRLQSA